MGVTRDQVWAWRLRRQFVGAQAQAGAVAVVERLCGVQAQVSSAAELAVAVRSATVTPNAVREALRSGRLMKTWAMRGTLHAVTPRFGAAALSLLASARTWEKPVWQRNFGASPAEVAALTDAVTRVLADGAVLTREELVGALVADAAFRRLGDELRSGWGALLKPLAWQGALCHGPAQGSKVTFASPARLLPDWPGLPEPEAAAPIAITGYLAAYGPATPEAFDAWLTRGALRKTTVRRWFSALGDRLTTVDVEGTPAYLLSEHADELAATAPDYSVHLLGAFDQYVLGPGTADADLLPTRHRAEVSRAAGWISPLVVVGGRIAGTWELSDDTVLLSMFDGAPLPGPGLDAAVDRLAKACGRTSLAVRAG
ncbi:MULTISPECIES: winged helix DNA-binding domain-containing protein [unclassified Nocardia]|uniref:winged helix DNA-binding domain-containing protein n=1 Tax=unclassified Nocardia TaxID=2637762 RepID=UPI001CE47AD8|nr:MULTISPECIES: winged helix DNA-binding domain-containing protein [unclassified Nocardia]